MEIIAQGPVRVTRLTWHSQSSAPALTVVCKMTFALDPIEASVVEPPDPITEQDGYWDYDPTKSIFSPDDLAPRKALCDVLVVGSAFAPGQQPTRVFRAQLLIGEVDKAIEVWCDRSFGSDQKLREGRPITRGSLRYERAAGGPGSVNPVGIAFDGPRDALGMRPVPNLQPLGAVVSKPGDVFAPVGFGPIAPDWPERAGKIHPSVGRFPTPGWTTRPLPRGLEPSFFNVAPHDQQVREIRNNERIVLVNLHPQHPRLVTSLPGAHPQVFVDRAGSGREPVGMRADTLWIDTDRGVCTVTWRGDIGLRSTTEPGKVIVAVAGMSDARRISVHSPAEGGETLFPVVPNGAPLPFSPAAPSGNPIARPRAPSPEEASSAEEISVDAADDPAGALPPTLFLPPDQQPKQGRELPFEPPAPKDLTLFWGPDQAVSSPAPSSPSPPVPPRSALPITPAPSPVAPPPPAPVPPPLVDARREPAGVVGPAIAPSPWGGVNREAPKAMTVGEAAAAAGQADRERALPLGPEPVKPKAESPSPAIRPPADAPGSVAPSAAAASDAAAREAKHVEARPAFTARPALELLWHNPGSLARIRRVEAWKKLTADLKPRPEEDDLDDDVPPPRRVPAKDRRELLAILSRGEPTDADGVDLAFRRALEDEAGYLPPLVLLAGELEMQFDELEMLKATIAAVSPHMTANESLRKTVEAIQEIFKTPFVQGANTVLVDLSRRLRDAFAPIQKALPTYDLDSHVHATLVDHRHYQKRSVFGQPRLRALFTTPGARAVVPAYLPDTLAKELPGFRRLRVRMIAEVRPRAEEGDSSAAALRGLALGREV